MLWQISILENTYKSRFQLVCMSILARNVAQSVLRSEMKASLWTASGFSLRHAAELKSTFQQ